VFQLIHGGMKLTRDLDGGVSGSIGLDVSFSSACSVTRVEDSLPRSPTCRSSSDGPPWFLPKGLKWDPAEVHPLLQISLALTCEVQLTCCLRTRWTCQQFPREGREIHTGRGILARR